MTYLKYLKSELQSRLKIEKFKTFQKKVQKQII